MCFMWFKMAHGMPQEGNRPASISACSAAGVSSAKTMGFGLVLLKAAVGALLLSLHLNQGFLLPLENRVLCSSPFLNQILQDGGEGRGEGPQLLPAHPSRLTWTPEPAVPSAWQVQTSKSSQQLCSSTF